MAWELVSLDDIVDIQYGYTASAKLKPVGPKFLRITDIVPDIIDWNSVPFCQINHSDYEKYKLKPGDIVIARTGATAGYAKLIRKKVDAVFASYLIRLTPKSSKALPEYLGRVIESSTFKEFIDLVKGGSAQPQANAPVIKRFQLALPPKQTQAQIAAVLSTYDDLIENNTRRIAILEEMAQALYREWFVHFRFPGHEDVEMVAVEGGNGNGGNGCLPKGWEILQFGDVSLNFDKKRVPLSVKERNTFQGVYPYYGASGIIDHVKDYLFDGTYLLISEDGANLETRKTPIAFVAHGKFWVNNHAHVVQGKSPMPTEFLRLHIANSDISGFITGAAQPKLSQRNLNIIPVIVPTKKLLSRFSEIVDPMMEQIKLLSEKDANLRQTRDLLLPRLISGELDV